MRDLKIHTFLLLLATLLPAVTHAYDFKQGNLYYKILSEEELTVATAENNDIRNPTYSGDIDIPSYVTYNGKRYTVTEIGGFANSPNVTSVTIPETATKVTHFYGGSTGSQGSGWIIKAVTGPGGNSSQTNDGVSSLKEIRFNAVNCTWCGFYSAGIPGMSQVTSWSYPFPPSVERIIIGSKVTRLPEYAFYLCTKVKTLTIPASVTEIGRNIIKTDSTDPVCQLSALNIYSSDLNCQWTLKDPSIINWKTTTFTAGMATLLGNPKDLIIPEGFTSVKKETFVGSKLESVNFPSTITEIEERAFAGSEIQSMTFTEPSQLKKIAKSAFSLCYNLQSIELPNPLTEVGEYAFGSCKSLKNITIPGSVNTIGQNAFVNCDNIENFILEDGLNPLSIYQGYVITNYAYIGREIKKEDNNHYLTVHTPTAVLSDKITDMDGIGFYDLTSITLPKQLTNLGAGTFYGCPKLAYIYLPETLTTIGDRAFSGCESLKSLELPKSVATIGKSAFAGSGITQITLPESLTKIEDWVFNCCPIATIDIPKSITAIGEYAFYGSYLTHMTIPNSVNTIGENAFGECRNLSEFIIEDGDTHISVPSYELTSEIDNVYIGRKTINKDGDFVNPFKGKSIEIGCKMDILPTNTFRQDPNLVSIALPDGMKSIEEGAFTGCPNLTTVKLPETLSNIDNRAFSGCTKLSSINLPESIISIGNYAFSKCENLESIILPEQLAEIGWGTFSNCTSLKSISIPNSVTKINQQAFFGCSSLESLEIGKSVELIWARAFCECPSLTDISVYRSTPPEAPQFYTNNECTQFGYLLFDEEVYGRATLSVPEGSIGAYRDTEPWSKFFNIKESGIEDVIADGNAEAEVAERQYYGIDGRVLGDKIPTVPGHYIERLRYADGKVTTNKIAVQ